MYTPNTPGNSPATPSEVQVLVANALNEALASALDNLPDVAGEADAQLVTACCADIAALQTLVALGPTGHPTIWEYL